jgi:branched-chain amino acid transport system permease protein
MGRILGVFFLTLMQEFLWTQIPYLHLAMYGIVMVLVGLFMPGGLVRTRLFGLVIQRFVPGDKAYYQGEP